MKVKARSLWRLLWPHARPYRWPLLVIFALGWVTAITEQSSVILVAPTWELMFPAEAPEGAAQPGSESLPALAQAKERLRTWVLGGEHGELDADLRMRLLLRVVGIISAIAVFSALVGYAFAMVSRWIALRMIMSLRIEVARHLIGLSLRYHSRRRFGDLLSRVSGDVGKAMTIANTVLKDLVQSPLEAVTALIAAFFMAPEAALLVVVGLPVLLFPVAKLLKQIRRRSTKSLGQLGASIQALSQMFLGIRTVKAFRAEKRELERFRGMNERFIEMTMKVERAAALTKAWTLLFSHLGLALVLLALGWLAVRQGRAGDSGEMAAFFLLISKVYTSVKVTTKAWSKVAEAQAACDRLNALFEEQPDIVERADARPCAGLGSGIRFEHVSFRYPGNREPAIDGVDLELLPGETLALVGPSGAGKSTLMDLVARFIDPTEGRITVDGVDLRDLSIDSWTSVFSMVTQEPFLFHASIAENIRYGKVGAGDAELEAAARAANIHEFIASLPKGYATDVADAGTRLSGGQRQRITIARAILHGGELLLLDEATSALDTESEAVVQAALERMMVGKTVVVIAHRLSTVRRADRIAVLDAGRVVELGTHDQLLAAGGLYARLYRQQFPE